MDTIKYARMFSAMTLPEILQTKPRQAISWDSKTVNLYSDLSNFTKKFYIIGMLFFIWQRYRKYCAFLLFYKF